MASARRKLLKISCYTLMYTRDIRSAISFHFGNYPVLKINYSTRITSGIAKYDYNTSWNTYILLEIYCNLILVECTIELIVDLTKEMSNLVTLIKERYKPPAKSKCWNNTKQAIYVKGDNGCMQLKSGEFPPTNCVTKSSLFLEYEVKSYTINFIQFMGIFHEEAFIQDISGYNNKNGYFYQQFFIKK